MVRLHVYALISAAGVACILWLAGCHAQPANQAQRLSAMRQEPAPAVQTNVKLPLLSSIVPAPGAWGPRNEEYGGLAEPRLPAYAGWYLQSEKTTLLAAAGPGMVLIDTLHDDPGYSSLRDYPAHLSALDARSGRLLWRAPSTLRTGGIDVHVTGGLVLINDSACSGFHLRDGALAKRSEINDSHGNLELSKNDPGWITQFATVFTHRQASGLPKRSLFLNGLGYDVLQEVQSNGQLLVAATDVYHNKKNASYVIFSFPLDRQGSPIPGKPEAAYPLDLLATVDEFYSLKDPLADTGLMTQVAGDSIYGLKQLLKEIKQAQPNHVLALIALCEYYRPDANAPGAISQAQTAAQSHQSWTMADSLIEALAAKPDPAWAPAVGMWLEQAPDDALAYRLCCWLMKMRTPAACASLKRFYDKKIYSRRQPLAPPYKLVKPVDTSRWASCPAASRRTPGLRDVAFIRWNSSEDGSIYIGLDVDLANMGQEILYTGLTDKRSLIKDSYSSYCEVQRPIGPLALKTSTTSAEIVHHIRAVDYQTIEAALQTSKVDYAALRADSDHDGLPDIVEKQLRLDPAIPDMDGDGVLDGADSLPNIDQSKFGPLERGVQRAMVCDLVLREDRDFHETQTPWSAEYFTAIGCAPVAISYTATGFGVYVDPDNWPSTGPGYCTIGVVDLRQNAATPAETPSQIFPAKYWRKLKSTPKEADLVVTLDMNLGGDVVFLAEIQGEYFPLEARNQWVT